MQRRLKRNEGIRGEPKWRPKGCEGEKGYKKRPWLGQRRGNSRLGGGGG